MDALSEVLRMVRLQGALFLNGEFHEPWCVQVPHGGRIAQVLCPGARQLAIVHMVLEGALLALKEAAAEQPGSDAMGAKVAEALFVETLRAYIDALPPQQSGWLAGLRDPQVGRCLALMHEQAGRPWSVESLAREVHMSRSVLAERFNELVGVPPMQYLKRWRLSVAARMLCGERSNLIQVAEAVGYESEASFSRAFKTEYGVAPGMWRSMGEEARR